MKTSYSDFRDYIEYRFPDWRYDNVPQEGTIAGGDYGYNGNEIAGYIMETIDRCSKENWSNLEESIGNDIYDGFSWELIDVDEARRSSFQGSS